MHIAIFTRQIGHYHNARYVGAANAVDKVTVISTANQGGFAEFLAKDLGGYDIVRLYDDREAYDAAVRAGALRVSVEAALTRVSPDVVFISGWTNPESMAAIRWARANNVATVMMSESQVDDASRSAIREFTKAQIVSLCDAGFVGGPSHADYMAQLGIPKSRIAFGYNAVDNAHYEAGSDAARKIAKKRREELGLPVRYILASARFIAKKNLPTLVEAYVQARASASDAPDLFILGDGEEKSAVEAAIAASKMNGHVHLPGYRGYDDLPSLYALSEGFAHISKTEQWGLVINEAMASAVPVVASEPCGATRTMVVDGQSGFVVSPDKESIANGLTRLFGLTPAQRKAMGKRAREHAADWGPARFGAGAAEAAKFALDHRVKASSNGTSVFKNIILSQLEKRAIASVS